MSNKNKKTNTITVTIANTSNPRDVRQVFEFTDVQSDHADSLREVLVRRLMAEMDWYRGDAPVLDEETTAIELMASRYERLDRMGLLPRSDDNPEPHDDRDWSDGEPE